MSLYDVIAASHGGRCIALLAQRFRIGEENAGVVLHDLLKLLSSALDEAIGQPETLKGLLGELGQGPFGNVLTHAGTFNDAKLRDHGQRLLFRIMPGAAVTNDRLREIAAAGGLTESILTRMMPIVVLLMLAAIRAKAERRMRQILATRRGSRLANHVSDPYSALISVIEDDEVRARRPHRGINAMQRLFVRGTARAAQTGT